MNEEQREIHVTIRTKPEQAREFLERLAAEEEFRAGVERDPRGTLARYGVEVPEDAVPETVALPKRGEIERMLAHLDEQDELGKTGHRPHGYAVLWCVLGAMPLVDAR